MLIFDGTVNFLFSQSSSLPWAYLGKNVPLCATSNTQKMTKNGPIWAKNGQKRTVENFGTTYLVSDDTVGSPGCDNYQVWVLDIQIFSQ